MTKLISGVLFISISSSQYLHMVYFGQVILGPPGSGKTTYCNGMSMFIEAIGRECAIVNLDFANDVLPYQATIDVRDLISLENVMEEFSLGPNGGIVFCMEYLLENIDWLMQRIESLSLFYILFDMPGQVTIDALVIV